jgi:pyrroline-5-carboxylate reductase
MGGALAEALLKYSGIPASHITISDPNQEALRRFEKQGASLTCDNTAAAMDANLLFVVVKPWLVQGVVTQLKDAIDYQRTTLVVIAAGVSSASILEWMKKIDGSTPTLFLAIPNTAIAVGESMTFLVPPKGEQAKQAMLMELFNKMGSAMIVDEEHLAAGTSIASCGIAYAMRYIRAATEGSVELGFRAADALKIVRQTVSGAVSLLAANGTHPEEEIDKVTTPGGVSIRGLNAMEREGFTNAVIQGLKAGTGK